MPGLENSAGFIRLKVNQPHSWGVVHQPGEFIAGRTPDYK